MRKALLKYMCCPNSGDTDLKIFSLELIRNGKSYYNLSNEEIYDTDDIKSGVVISLVSKSAYPIYNSIGVFLSDADVNIEDAKNYFKNIETACPQTYSSVINETINRIVNHSATEEGKWNRDEMHYYDKDVSTDTLRNQMVESIKNLPLWRIFLPRKKQIINIIAPYLKNEKVLEIGCGNSRTIANIFNPSSNSYSYVGTDISFNRLLVAKIVIPEGDFIQASALNLPFTENSFNAIISFGMLHHLPHPEEAIVNANKLLCKNGFFAFHEPVYSGSIPKIFSKVLRRLGRVYEHSTHDGKIDKKAIKKVLSENKLLTVNYYEQISIFRAVTETLIKRISPKLLLSKTVILCITAIDGLLISVFCKLSDFFGPKAIIMVTKKS